MDKDKSNKHGNYTRQINTAYEPTIKSYRSTGEKRFVATI